MRALRQKPRCCCDGNQREVRRRRTKHSGSEHGERCSRRRSNAQSVDDPFVVASMANPGQRRGMTAAPPPFEPVIRTIAMPADTNPAGDIFGGWLLAQMDLAAGSAATRRARGRCATVALDAMAFLKPVFVGDEVSLYAMV